LSKLDPTSFKKKLHYSHKKKTFRYKERDEKKRADFLEKIKEIPEKRLVFVDETGFQTFFTRMCGYALRGLRLLAERPGRKIQRLNVVGAMKDNKIIAASIYSENTNTQVFNTWVEDCLCKALEPGDVVILDNASFHKSKATIELIEAVGACVLFLPPYSPDFNKIEKFWGTLKKRVRGEALMFEALKDAIKICITNTSDEILAMTDSH
jgi:transposase